MLHLVTDGWCFSLWWMELQVVTDGLCCTSCSLKDMAESICPTHKLFCGYLHKQLHSNSSQKSDIKNMQKGRNVEYIIAWIWQRLLVISTIIHHWGEIVFNINSQKAQVSVAPTKVIHKYMECNNMNLTLSLLTQIFGSNIWFLGKNSINQLK